MSSTLAAAVPAARSIIYLSMDAHKDSITSAVLPAAVMRDPDMAHAA